MHLLTHKGESCPQFQQKFSDMPYQCFFNFPFLRFIT